MVRAGRKTVRILAAVLYGVKYGFLGFFRGRNNFYGINALLFTSENVCEYMYEMQEGW
jgi:hypothetical protein